MAEDKAVTEIGGEAIGYSEKFSIMEAFEEAITNLPPTYPHDYDVYRVIEMGIERGGFVGVNRLFVRINRSTRPPGNDK